MRKLYFSILSLLMVIACQDPERISIGGDDSFTNPEITTGPEDKSYVFLEEQKDELFTKMEWSEADFGVVTQISYDVIAHIEGYDETAIVTSVSGSKTEVEISVKEVNEAVMSILKLLSDVQIQEERIELEVMAYMSDASDEDANSSSATTGFDLTPYFSPALPSNRMWVRGNHQGWTENDPLSILGSPETEGGPYDGYIYLDGGYKVCQGPGWGDGDNFGVPAGEDWVEQSDGSLKTAISADGGDLSSPIGMYYMNTNGSSELTIKELVFKVEGSAVAAPVELEYDAVNRYLSGNVSFLDGTFTFKASDDHNFGGGEVDGLAVNGGEPISITAGDRFVILDLKNPGTYIYILQDPVVITPPELDVPSETTYVLDENNAGNNLITFNWSAAVFGDQTVTSYKLMYGGQTVYDGLETSYTVTTGELNGLTLANGGEENVAADYEVKVIATMSEGSELTSNMFTMNVTPYPGFQPDLWLAGPFNGWNNANDTTTLSLVDVVTGDYQGLYLFTQNNPPDDKQAFKVIEQKGNWDSQWGDNEPDGVLDPKNGGDPAGITIDANGYYTVVVNWPTKEYTLTPEVWGLIGSATPSGWDADTDMTFDGVDTYTITADMVIGEYKFRLANSWDTNLGDDGSGQPELNSSANFQLAEEGNYTITLTLDEVVNGIATSFSTTITKN